MKALCWRIASADCGREVHILLIESISTPNTGDAASPHNLSQQQ
jgi:hypothetical protein